MRKNVKFLTVLSTAAVMTAVTPGMAAIPSFIPTVFAASTGWVEEDGELRYKDSDGYYLTDTWKKRDNDWYYLNEDGFLSRSEKVDEYYVDEDGKRVLNTWITEENEDNWGDDEPENYWYYYGKDGKNVISKWQTIDGKEYYFNEEGYMETGKITLGDYTYYLGEEGDGGMKKGWIQLANEDEDAENDTVWHYFDSRGRMVMNEVDRKINGAYYTFENGIMQTGWYKLPETTADTDATEISVASASDAAAAPAIASYQYYAEDGKRASGWYTIEGIEGIHEDGEESTFYFKDGKPHYAKTGIQIFVIDSKRYGFNTLGERQTDLQTVTLEDGTTTANYYFGEDGIVRTGKQTIFSDELGENQTWFFLTDGANKGQGFHGIRDNSVYHQGLRLDADRDLRYAPVTLDGVRYLVNTSGVLQKASASTKSSAKPELGSGYKDVKDSNDKVWTVDVNGIIQE
jgi:glucan-binding YG repeat protein